MDQNEAVHVLWDYMVLHQHPVPADCIIGFGCYNTDVALRAAELYLTGYAPMVLFTGGLGRNTEKMWQGSSEAEKFREIAISAGVPADSILLEDRSTNSAQNLLFSKGLLVQLGMRRPRILAVHKPYMERRLYAAFPVYWPEANVTVTSPQQSYEAYIKGVHRWGRQEADTIQMLVGDFVRIDHYASLGYQIPQDIPESAWEACRVLVARGFTQQLPREFAVPVYGK